MENKNKKSFEECLLIFGICLSFGFLICMLLVAIIDNFYIAPSAAENANIICQEQGYDFYESFERIGILSSTPVAIKCKYVDNYKEIDLTQHYSGGSD